MIRTNIKLGRIKERLVFERALKASCLALSAFVLTFVFGPYLVLEANAAINVADVGVDWSAVSLDFDPDYGNGSPSDAGHGDVNFGSGVSPTTSSGSNKGTMVVVKKTLRTQTSGVFYSVFLSTGSEAASNALISETDSSKTIPAIGDGTSTGTWGNPVAFSDSAWGYAVPGTNIASLDSTPVTPNFTPAGSATPASSANPNQANTFSGDNAVYLGAQLNANDHASVYNKNTWAAVPLYSEGAQQIYSKSTTAAGGFSTGDSIDIYYAVMVDTDILAGTYKNTLMYTAIASSDAIDSASQNITRSDKYVGGGFSETISFDMTSSASGFLTPSNTHIYVVPHADFVAGYDETGDVNTYTVTTKMTNIRTGNTEGETYAGETYDECVFTANDINTSGTGVSITCTMPTEETLGNNDGKGQYDFWVHVDDYNFDYLSKYTDGNGDASGNLVASAWYVGLQSRDSSGYIVTNMQEMTPGICASTNMWGTGTGAAARVYDSAGEQKDGTGTPQGTPAVADVAGWTDAERLQANAALGVGTFALTDTRDNKDYLVRRLADGNCWMVQNLDLEIGDFNDSSPISSAKSNLSADWDPYASTNTKINTTYASQLSNAGLTSDFAGLSTWLLGSANPQQYQYQPQGVYGSNYKWGSYRASDSETVAEIQAKTGDPSNNAYAEIPRSYSNTKSNGDVIYVKTDGLTGTTVSGEDVTTGLTSGTWDSARNQFFGSEYFGQYYNWYAATAETGKYTSTSTVSGSICPKGWQLPVNSTATGAKSWYNLIQSDDYYDLIDTAGTQTAANSKFPTSDNPDKEAAWRMHQIPLSIPFTGLYNWTSGALRNRGGLGYFWSSTASSTAGAYYLYFNGTGVSTHSYYGKVNGFTVRCVAQ